MEANGPQILETPIWVLGARVAQALISLVILAMAGNLIHGAYLDEHGLCIAISLFTWIVVAYNILSEKIPALNKIYHVIAVIVLDGVMMILWLATFAATAARRATFVYSTSVSTCYDDGSNVNAITCARDLDTRATGTILFKKGQAMMSANAGLGALVWLLFIATFTWTMVFFFKGRKEGRFHFDNEASGGFQMDNKAQTQPTEIQPVPVQQPIQPQQTGGYEKNDFQTQQTAYQAPATYPPQQYPQQPYQPAVSPQPTTPSPAPGAYQAQELYGQQPQQFYPPQGSELSGSEAQHQAPYYPTQSPPPQGYQYPPHPPPQQ